MSRGDERLGRRVRWSARVRASALLIPAAALLLGACGSSSATTGASAQGSTVQRARGVQPIPRPLGASKVIVRPTGPVKARKEAGGIDDEVNASGAKTLNPCTLVTVAEASTILGKPVDSPVDAQQGPTCVYRAQGRKSFVTVAVVATHFSTVKPQAHLQDRISLTIAGRNAYCGVAGVPTLFVPLSAGRYLSVVAPCPIAASFAAKALGRIA